MNVNDRSSKIVISTGTIVPRWFSVCALYALQKSMIATPCGPSAVPTGGAGVAAPAGIWILTIARTFFLAIRPFLYFVRNSGTVCSRETVWRQLQLGDLGELELDRGLPAEDVDEHLELELVLVDLDDLAGEVRERTLLDPDGLAHLVLEAGLGALGDLVGRLGGDGEERLDVAAGQRRGLGALADEARD